MLQIAMQQTNVLQGTVLRNVTSVIDASSARKGNCPGMAYSSLQAHLGKRVLPGPLHSVIITILHDSSPFNISKGKATIFPEHVRLSRCKCYNSAEPKKDSMKSMDSIFITDLRADAVIGIYEHERSIKQTISIDLELGADIAKAAANDSIEDALNYKVLSKRVEAYIMKSEFQLIETLAERIAELILNEFSVPWLTLTLHKVGALSNSGDVGVRIKRISTD